MTNMKDKWKEILDIVSARWSASWINNTKEYRIQANDNVYNILVEKTWTEQGKIKITNWGRAVRESELLSTRNQSSLVLWAYNIEITKNVSNILTWLMWNKIHKYIPLSSDIKKTLPLSYELANGKEFKNLSYEQQASAIVDRGIILPIPVIDSWDAYDNQKYRAIEETKDSNYNFYYFLDGISSDRYYSLEYYFDQLNKTFAYDASLD